MVTQTTMSNQQNDSSKDSGASSSREKKKRGLSLSSLKSPFKFLGKTYCKGCHKKCSGEVLRVGDLYFHNGCFNCKGCSTSLSQGYIDFTPYSTVIIGHHFLHIRRYQIIRKNHKKL